MASEGTVIAQGSPGSLAVVLPAVVVVATVAAALLLPDLVAENGRGEFLLVTFFLGGGAGWLSGRAIASTWRAYRQVLLYALLLACVVRFLHFALFEGELLSLYHFIIEALFLTAVTTLGFRAERASQMSTRYSWLYRQSGPFGWLSGSGAPAAGSDAP